MEKDNTQKVNTEIKKAEVGAPKAVASSAKPVAPMFGADAQSRGRGPRRDAGGRRGGPGGQRKGTRERIKPEFDQKIIDIRRVTRVVAGGKRFSFSVALVAGNKKGSVGFGIGKAGDTSLAIEKAFRNAKKNMVKLNLTKKMSIPYNVDAKYCSSRVLLIPAPGRGMIAGSSVRSVLELGGVKDIGAKLLSRSKNKLNNAKVAIKALSMFGTPKAVSVVSAEPTVVVSPASAPVKN